MKLSTSLVIAVILTGCNGGRGVDSTATKPTTKPTVPVSPAPETTELADITDERMLNQISKSIAALKADDIWKGYGDYYSKSPKYSLRVNEEDGVKQPEKAFLINPTKINAGYQRIGKNENYGLNVYRYDTNMHLANDKLKSSAGGNESFDFYYEFEGGKYYLQNYAERDLYSPEQKKEVASFIALHVHESFHVFQDRFTLPKDTTQDFEKYPVNKDQILLRLMIVELFKGLPKAMTSDEAKQLLKKYVALTQEQINTDSTGLVKQMGPYQEWLEGAPMYVDVMVTRRILESEKNRTFDYMPILPSVMESVDSDKISDAEKAAAVRSFFAQGLFYPTGSSAIWLLSKAGYPITEQIEKGVTPFDAARTVVGSFDQNAIMDEIRASMTNYGELVKQSEKLAKY